jgi:hypothetical protein
LVFAHRISFVRTYTPVPKWNFFRKVTRGVKMPAKKKKVALADGTRLRAAQRTSRCSKRKEKKKRSRFCLIEEDCKLNASLLSFVVSSLPLAKHISEAETTLFTRRGRAQRALMMGTCVKQPFLPFFFAYFAFRLFF